jgi:hypothetical protein
MGAVVNRLLRQALRASKSPRKEEVEWRVFDVGEALVDVNDRHALEGAMEER